MYLDDQNIDRFTLFKILLYGLPKTKKSWWAAKAAESGFNVLYLAAEPNALGREILSDLSPAAKSRIFYVDITDEIERSVTSIFLRKILSGQKTIPWNTRTKREHIVGKVDPTDIIQFTAKAFDENTVVVLDPWSKICDSLSKEYDEVHEKTHDETDKTDWTGYGWAGRRATFFVQQLIALPCHVILVAHEMQWEKKKTIQDGDKERVITEFSRKQIKSVSGPHAMTMPGNFGEILYFRTTGMEGMNAQIQIDTRLENGRDGGCRNLPPKTWEWKDCTFETLCKEAGVPLPEKDRPQEISGITVGLEPTKTKTQEQPAPQKPLSPLASGNAGTIKPLNGLTNLGKGT